jgi:predicted ribonuclease toxin of YeeF-YezG toxin-antitoxin module
MAHAPAEVAAVVQDAASQLEDIYTLLKFQTQHYKSMLAKATRKIQQQSEEIQSLTK